MPVLDATPAGRPLYRALGFEETWGYHRLARASAAPMREDASSPTAQSVRPIADADWAAFCAIDAAAFGADRSALLRRLRGRLPPAELVAERNGRIAGFMLGRNGRSASQIGPLIAEDEDVAHALLARALPAIDGPDLYRFRRQQDSTSRLARGMRILSAAAADAHAARPLVKASTTRRAPSPWSDRSSAETKRPAATAAGLFAVLISAQYSFGGLIAGILMLLSRNSLV